VFYTDAGPLRPTSAHAMHFTAVFLYLKQSYFCDLLPCRGSETNFSACRTLHNCFPVFRTELLLCSTPMQGLWDQLQCMPYTSQQFSCVSNRAIAVFYTHAGPLRPTSAHAVHFTAVLFIIVFPKSVSKLLDIYTYIRTTFYSSTPNHNCRLHVYIMLADGLILLIMLTLFSGFLALFLNENEECKKKLAVNQEIKRGPSWFHSFILSFICLFSNCSTAFGWALACTSVS
jgi:hypothetical protein